MHERVAVLEDSLAASQAAAAAAAEPRPGGVLLRPSSPLIFVTVTVVNLCDALRALCWKLSGISFGSICLAAQNEQACVWADGYRSVNHAARYTMEHLGMYADGSLHAECGEDCMRRTHEIERLQRELQCLLQLVHEQQSALEAAHQQVQTLI